MAEPGESEKHENCLLVTKQVHLEETQVTGTGIAGWATARVLHILPLGGFRNWDRQGKEGFPRDCRGTPALIKGHSMIKVRSKSYFWGWWEVEVERTVQNTGQGKKWGIRRKFRLGVGDACLMFHWDYWGCRCPWWCYEYLRLDIRRVGGKVIFPGTWCSLKKVLFRDHCVQPYGLSQETDH